MPSSSEEAQSNWRRILSNAARVAAILIVLWLGASGILAFRAIISGPAVVERKVPSQYELEEPFLRQLQSAEQRWVIHGFEWNIAIARVTPEKIEDHIDFVLRQTPVVVGTPTEAELGLVETIGKLGWHKRAVGRDYVQYRFESAVFRGAAMIDASKQRLLAGVWGYLSEDSWNIFQLITDSAGAERRRVGQKLLPYGPDTRQLIAQEDDQGNISIEIVESLNGFSTLLERSRLAGWNVRELDSSGGYLCQKGNDLVRVVVQNDLRETIAVLLRVR